MSDLSYDRLSDDDIAKRLESLAGWTVDDGMLAREFVFDSYGRGVMFATACGHLADDLNHHPDLFIGYQKVRVALVTHDAGGLTAYDFEMARRIQAIA